MGLDVLALTATLEVKIINDLALAVTVKIADQFLQPIEVILTERKAFT